MKAIYIIALIWVTAATAIFINADAANSAVQEIQKLCTLLAAVIVPYVFVKLCEGASK